MFTLIVLTAILNHPMVIEGFTSKDNCEQNVRIVEYYENAQSWCTQENVWHYVADKDLTELIP